MQGLMKMQNDPRAKAKDFAQGIVDCKEYKEFMQAFERLRKDGEAQNLLERFQEKQRELQGYGFKPTLMDELRELQMALNLNKVIQEFERSQQDLVALLVRTNTLISATIGVQFAYPLGGGCCG